MHRSLVYMILQCIAVVSITRSSSLDVCVVNKDGNQNCGEEMDKHKYTEEKQTPSENEVGKEENLLLDETAKEETEFVIKKKSKNGLARRDGVKIGHVEEVDLGQGKIVKVTTKSMRPLLFEISDFLTDQECDHIIKRARDPAEGGMFQSKAKGGLTEPSPFKISGKKGSAGGFYNHFAEWDTNKDDVIDIKEVISMVHKRRVLTMTEKDVREMFKSLNETVFDNDDVLDKEEFEGLNSLGMEDYLHGLWLDNPRFKERFSQQAWLHMEQWIDPMVHEIRERLVKLSGLTRDIIYGGEQLQVVHYQPGGHYHAHHDSETHKRNEVPCCHQFDGDTLESVGVCKLCRYITFVMYLNDVEEGGETAFPVAGDESYDPDIIRSHGNATADKYNLSHGCHRANVLVKPKKRQAVLWYNHLRNETDGWMGELDEFSLHGGCDVIKGEKWIANMWIPAPFGKAKDKQSIYLIPKDYELAEALGSN